MKTLGQLSTPALVLERGRLVRNAERMRARASSLGVSLRPHLKTTKSAPIAEIADAGGGATVSTLREAEYLAEHGHHDLVWAVCATPDKLDRAAALLDRGVSLILLTDDPQVASAIASHPSDLRALIEIDSGDHRTGVLPGSDAMLAIGTILGDRLAGVLTHAGQSYRCRSVVEVVEVAEIERAAVVVAADVLRSAGLPCPVVSVGSTPTASHAVSLEGVTEIRPGVYLLGDLFQVAIGSCALEDIAASVLATVIHRSLDRIVIDAGGLALSKDRSTAATDHDAGYGRICTLSGDPTDAIVHEVHQEHGLIRATPGLGLAVGDRVRVLPNHACMTAAAHDRYHVVDQGTTIEEIWERANGW